MKKVLTRHNSVSIWLLIGVLMILLQILIGGVTRLTDSGLSITEWNVIKGVLPPLNDSEWILSFEKYQSFAKKQYQTIHRDMSLDEFKTIFYWEYFHRLWARVMFLVYLIPLLFFMIQKKISLELFKGLALVFLLAGISGFLGWFMVKSGLQSDQRTWVSAYRLMFHLAFPALTLGVLFHVYIRYTYRLDFEIDKVSSRFIGFLLFLVYIQILLGALVSGMKGASSFPYFSLLMNWKVVGALWTDAFAQNANAFWDYESNISIKFLFHLFHRINAYLIFILASIHIMRQRTKLSYIFGVGLIVQIILGLATAMTSIPKVIIYLALLHQFWGFLIFLFLTFYRIRIQSKVCVR
ncbi:MAG: COX15/CtaA family protein [Chitinophagales bacterium]|jgi:cytochrome c oxidase assembly protein subunit 15|nr:COX15/CtaA family protein [Chitinophagales bacterium]